MNEFVNYLKAVSWTQGYLVQVQLKKLYDYKPIDKNATKPYVERKNLT